MVSIKDAKITNIEVIDEKGKKIDTVHLNECFKIHVNVLIPINTDINIAFKIFNSSNQEASLKSKELKFKMAASSQYSDLVPIDTYSDLIDLENLDFQGKNSFIKIKTILDNGEFKTTLLEVKK
ncbi:hypothetical protein [Limosilactobacillus reuteri]|uniref:hypothetical protein n=1 Tax=Limosilactobacillus reuteri TaxID=1598 RepID=UPI00081C0032|nr:hypothetical protein [Limosilactobacillus reuteri]OCW63689.1 hypothetical protein BBP12_06325 [Limosilactobacillus reuteri]OCW65659.1 hypothetical protein BBP11_04850 [Limosilactobacillus reuteri]OCW66068.1 hypothetical protein BBP10_02790 [Limosilactobacillus reuteri]OCW70846.1 hypothetical protein BBP13_04550 [Limosilactobacillus reuteri]